LLRFSIAAKLYVIFGLLAATIVALATAAVINARNHAVLTAEFKSAFLGAKSVEQVNSLIYAVVMESRGIYMSTDVASVKVYADALLKFDAQISDVVDQWQHAVRADDADQFEAFSQRIRQFQEFRRELVRRAIQIGPPAGREWGDNDANRSVRKALNDDLEKLGKLYAKRVDNIDTELARGINATAFFLTVFGALTVLLAGAGAVIIWGAVARPLAEITRVTKEVAGGTEAVTVPYHNRTDEIGALARSITVFQQAMRRNEELKRGTEAAEARFRRQEQISQEISHFNGEIELTLAELGRISEQMLTAATHFSEAAERTAGRTALATKASAEASHHMNDIASAIDDLVASTREIDRQVVQSNNVSTEVAAETKRTNKVVKGLDDAAGRIGNVIKLITDIAEQTNLLALNATIEAARAGAAGRGFAVVAGEVKGLAGQTANATKEIAAQVEGMQNATLGSIEAISAIGKTVGAMRDISGTIVKALAAQGAATEQIADSAEVAAKHTAETANEIKRLSEATADTHANAAAVKAVADDLNGVTGRMRDQMAQFFQRLHAA